MSGKLKRSGESFKQAGSPHEECGIRNGCSANPPKINVSVQKACIVQVHKALAMLQPCQNDNVQKWKICIRQVTCNGRLVTIVCRVC